MVQKNRTSIDCACVIHGSLYTWEYVEKLYNMLQRNFNLEVRLHVYTEEDRPVPSHMIKHVLEDWPGANRQKKGWWYKMQLFNKENFGGDLLYFDLDVVIVNSLDWIVELPTNNFWTIRDFRYLQNENLYKINSSVMWWNVSRYNWVWDKFKSSDIDEEMRSYPGDQDYIESTLKQEQRQYFLENKITSWRWQAHDGGFDFSTRKAKVPGSGDIVPDSTSILVFHGQPKPHELMDNVVVKQHWR